MKVYNWILDPAHSEIQFKIKHLMITNVTGSFNNFEVQASSDELDFTNADILFKALVNSISTNNEQRDNHLKSADFFDTQKYPEILFKSTNIQNIDNDNFVLFGDLTIKKVTKNIKTNVEFGGIVKDPYGNLKAGFSLKTTINRKDFDLGWNAVLETGGLMVGDEVKISAEIQLIKQE